MWLASKRPRAKGLGWKIKNSEDECLGSALYLALDRLKRTAFEADVILSVEVILQLFRT